MKTGKTNNHKGTVIYQHFMRTYILSCTKISTSESKCHHPEGLSTKTQLRWWWLLLCIFYFYTYSHLTLFLFIGSWKCHGEARANLPREPCTYGSWFGSGASPFFQGRTDPEHGPCRQGDHYGGTADLQTSQKTGLHMNVMICSKFHMEQYAFIWLMSNTLQP